MQEIIDQLKQQFAAFGPNLLAGLAVLVIGWLVAVVVSFLVRKLLGRTSADNKLAQWMSGPESKTSLHVEEWAGKIVFYVIMLVVVIAFLQTIKLTVVTDPLNQILQPVMAYLPRLVGAAVLALVAWVLATVLKKVIIGALQAAKFDEKVGGATGESGLSSGLSAAFAEVVYWLVFLLFLPAILEALDLKSLLEPVTSLFDKVFSFLPNILSAAAILAIGWLVARIVQRILQSLLASAGTDRLSEKWGLAASLGSQKLSGVLGLVVYYVILVPVLIAALGALQLDAVTKPASDMLGKMMGALPNIVGAMIILIIALVIGRVVAGIVTNLLAGMGFNNVLVKLGMARKAGEGRQAPAAVVGLLCLAAIILFATVTAAEMLNFEMLAGMIKEFIAFAGHIIMGLVIFALGILLAGVVARGISTSDSPHAGRLALAARVVILLLTGAMALRQTGLANEIVHLAFGLSLGAVAVALALAFGLGGRDLAARTLNEWRDAAKDKPPK